MKRKKIKKAILSVVLFGWICD